MKKKLFNIKFVTKDDVPISHSLRIVQIICILIGCFTILGLLLGAFNYDIATFIWKNILIPGKGLFFYLSQVFTFKILGFRGGLFYLLVLFIIILMITDGIVLDSKSITKKERNAICNSIRMITYPLLTLELVIVFGFGYMSYNNPKMDTLYFKEESNKTYTEKDLIQLNQYLENKVIEYSHMMERDDNGNIIHDSLIDIAISDLRKASKNYDILKGLYPRKLYHFDDYDRSHDPTLYGLTTIDSVGVSFDQEAPALLNTITHELCHTKEVVRENEATLCSIIVGLESDNKLSQYAAYMEAYGRSVDAIYLIDKNIANESIHNFQTLCTTNHYKEICNWSSKNTTLYVKKSDMIAISTFSLNTYEEGFIINFLEGLKDYSPKLYMDDKKISKEKLTNYLNTDKRVTIMIKNSKDIFKKISPYLDENKDKFSQIAQMYPHMYKGVDLDREEAIKYYTSSIPNSNIFSFFSGDLMELFDYSRVVRLVLEYFDYKNIGYY